MMTLLESVRHALPLADRDPYQREISDIFALILIATEETEAQCDAVGTCLAFFLEDPPLSLLFDSPAAASEQLARRLENLAKRLRAGVSQLRSLKPYIDQFDSPSSAMGEADGGSRQVHRRDGEVPATAGPDECPF